MHYYVTLTTRLSVVLKEAVDRRLLHLEHYNLSELDSKLAIEV